METLKVASPIFPSLGGAVVVTGQMAAGCPPAPHSWKTGKTHGAAVSDLGQQAAQDCDPEEENHVWRDRWLWEGVSEGRWD